MSVVVVACCRLSGEAEPSCLFPDGDRGLLVRALAAVGLEAVAVSWDDPGFDWVSPAGVLVSSTWDSVDRPEEYVRWARRVSATTTLVNPAEVIEWNLDKTYLRDLAGVGLRVLPTEWVPPGGSWSGNADGDVVVKPSVSAGGRDTAWYSQGQSALVEAHVARLVGLGHTVMVQPYVVSVDDPGEIDLIYIDGRFSHGVRKKPLLERDVGVLARPWERMGWLGLAEPTAAERSLGDDTAAVLAARFGDLVYGRVDIVALAGGEPALLEVELIDPNLSLSDFPEAATRLAAAVVERLPGN